jgi:hypothetical protein
MRREMKCGGRRSSLLRSARQHTILLAAWSTVGEKIKKNFSLIFRARKTAISSYGCEHQMNGRKLSLSCPQAFANIEIERQDKNNNYEDVLFKNRKIQSDTHLQVFPHCFCSSLSSRLYFFVASGNFNVFPRDLIDVVIKAARSAVVVCPTSSEWSGDLIFGQIRVLLTVT